MRVRSLLCLLLPCLLAGAGCNHRRDGGSGALDGPGPGDVPDLAGPVATDLDAGGGCSDQSPCPAAQRCHLGACIPDHGACHLDDECQDDTWCECKGDAADGGSCAAGACVPWGTGARGRYDDHCGSEAFPAAEFKAPVLRCLWQEGMGLGATLSTPLVADLDGDKIPEIIFGPAGRIVALRGKDCAVYFDSNAQLTTGSQYAIGDLDGDKVPEIVGLAAGGLVKVFDNQGQLLATSPAPYKYMGRPGQDVSAPAIANIDGAGFAEIVIAGQVLRYKKGDPTLEVLFNNSPPAPSWGFSSAVADLDGDGRAEVIAGNAIYDGISGADKTPAALANLGWMTAGSYPAVADFNGDGLPDIALVRSERGNQQLAVIDYADDKVLFGPYGVQNGGWVPGGWGGPPTVADFDGDGVPEIGVASASNYFAYALKCARQPRPKECTGVESGVLWQKNTQDISSGSTGSTAFDFNGDGQVEVVYRDECWLRVYNGKDGKTLFAAKVSSGTGIEYPVVADVDNDGHADIVVSADDGITCQKQPEWETNTPWSKNTRGIMVLRDPMNRWMPSRPLWNQHGYHITNINDDLTIPARETPNWLTWNNYRQNIEGGAGQWGPKGDLTGGVAVGVDVGQKDCAASWTLRANLCNRGKVRLPPGISGTFYGTDPRVTSGSPICTAVSKEALPPGACELVECDWKMPVKGATDLWFRGDDDGTGRSAVGECKEMNNLLSLPHSECMQVQ